MILSAACRAGARDMLGAAVAVIAFGASAATVGLVPAKAVLIHRPGRSSGLSPMSDSAAFLAIAVMAIVTYLTRVAGVWLVSLAPVTRRVERLLHHVSGSVLAALTVSVIFSGDIATAVGAGAAAIAMLATRSSITALVVGVLCAVIIRHGGSA